MSNIRVNYSGFISLISGIVSISFGLIFSLTVVRKLSPEEYGAWGLLFSMVNYLLISEVIISFWTTRQIARNEGIGKTSILTSASLSIFLLPIFVVYAFVISQNSPVTFETLLFGLILIPVSFISQTLGAINLGHKPHALGITQVIFQVIKIPVAITTIIIFNFDIFGVVLAILFAFLGKIVIQLYFARSKLISKFSFTQLKWWLKFSWVPLFGHINNFFTTIDIVLYSIITGSVIGIAIYNAAYTIAVIVGQSTSLSQPLYSKLLYDKNYTGIQTNLTYLLYFAILLSGISIVFSKPALFALNPFYENAWPIVIILSLKFFIQAIRIIPTKIISGTEQIDLAYKPKFSQIIKSNLFKLPKIFMIFNVCYLILLVVFLFLFRNSVSELDLIIWWSLIGLVVEIPLAIFLWVYSSKYAHFSFPLKHLLKYLFAITIMVGFFQLSSEYVLNYNPSIYEFLPTLLLELFLCVLVYFGITYLIDQNTKHLLKSILNEIKK